MRRVVIGLFLLSTSLAGWGQTWRQAAEANDTSTVTFSPTVAGSVDVVLSYLSPAAGSSVTDNKGQTYTLDACTTPLNGVQYGDAHVCVWYVCGGAAGVTSATVTAAEGGDILATEFFEGTGIITTPNCAGAVNSVTNPNAPTLITLTPDEPSELAVVGFSCAGLAHYVNGNVTYSNQFDDAGNPTATTVVTSTTTLTAETDDGNADCIPSDDENPNGWNSVFAAFRTTQPTTSCPASAPVPAMANCAYNENLGTEAAGSTSSAQTLSVSIASGTNVGSIAVLTTGIAGKDFAMASGGTCAAANYSNLTDCTVKVNFTPLASGLRRGAVVFYSGANNTGTALATFPLYGVGTGPQIAFGPGGAQSNVGSGFSSPQGVAVDGAGDVFVADPGVPAVYKIAPGGTQTSLGSGFTKPEGVAVDGAGNVYVADSGGAAVYMVPPEGTQVAVGSGFTAPSGVALDGAGDLFVADSAASAVFEITPAGTQSKVGSGFIKPDAVAVDGAGNVYVADAGVPAVYEIPSGGAQATVGSGFSSPEGVAVDGAGDVYVDDAGSDTIYKITPGGVQTTVSAGFNVPAGMGIDGAGNLYVANSGKSSVIKIDRVDAPSLTFATTTVGSTSSDSPKKIEVENIGNAALAVTNLTYPADFPEATGDASACTGTTSLTPASQCDLPIDFTPLSAATLSESLKLTDNSLNGAGVTQSLALSGIGAGIPATITSPIAGSVLLGSSVTFVWSGGVGVADYQLLVGTTGANSSNVYNSGVTQATTETITVPTAGQTLYVLLKQLINGTWQSSYYTYTEFGTQILAAITSPAPGSTLTSGSVTFEWPGSNVAVDYQLLVGTTGTGSSNIYSSGTITKTSATVTVPTLGAKLYVQLKQKANGTWTFINYTFTEFTALIPAAITSPSPGSTLTSGSVTFEWAGSNVATGYQLFIGTTGVNSSNVYNSGFTKATSATVTVPTTGAPLYVLLKQLINGTWQSSNYTYTESGSPIPATISAPTAGSTLSSASVTFQWPGSNVATNYQLFVGTTGANSSNVYNSGIITATSATVTVPTIGAELYVLLKQLINGSWQSTNYTYTEWTNLIPAAVTSPAAGSTLPGATVTFAWPGSNVAVDYQLFVGTTGVGSSNVYNSGVTTATSETVTVPTNGGTLYVVLKQLINGTWQSTNYTYTEAGSPIPATMTSPTPGSTLTSTSVTFVWGGSNIAVDYQLLVGTTGVNSSNVYNSGVITATSAAVTVPNNGTTLYVLLKQLINGTWQSTYYTYTEP